jgi:hypothetical protein
MMILIGGSSQLKLQGSFQEIDGALWEFLAGPQSVWKKGILLKNTPYPAILFTLRRDGTPDGSVSSYALLVAIYTDPPRSVQVGEFSLLWEDGQPTLKFYVVDPPADLQRRNQEGDDKERHNFSWWQMRWGMNLMACFATYWHDRRPNLLKGLPSGNRPDLPKKESNHYHYPHSKRREIVEHYRRDKRQGKVRSMDNWSHFHYCISGRTLRSYIKEFPEES